MNAYIQPIQINDTQVESLEYLTPYTTAPNSNLLADLAQQRRQHPKAIAVQMDDNPLAKLSYQQLDTFSNQIARRLQDADIGAGTVVGVLSEHSLARTAGIIGVMKAQATCLPLEPALPVSYLAAMLNDDNIEVLLVHSELLSLTMQLAAIISLEQGRRVVIQTLDDSFENLRAYAGQPLAEVLTRQ